MEPVILTLKEKKLIGKHLIISLADNKTGELWKSFMARRREITDHLTNDLISISIYGPTYFTDFKLTNEFEKWAAIEVSDFDNIPNDMEPFTLAGGLYAVFHYKGSGKDIGVFQYILGIWIPDSIYLLDNRPHFEILGSNYKNDDPASEEEIWIPVKTKQ